MQVMNKYLETLDLQHLPSSTPQLPQHPFPQLPTASSVSQKDWVYVWWDSLKFSHSFWWMKHWLHRYRELKIIDLLYKIWNAIIDTVGENICNKKTVPRDTVFTFYFLLLTFKMASPERIELPTRGFGDRRSTSELWGYIKFQMYQNLYFIYLIFVISIVIEEITKNE